MRIGLVIYGNLTTISGGYLYDRMLVEHLHRRGDDIDIISLPWRTYGHRLLDNASEALSHRLLRTRFDVLLQDELNHPSLFWLNRRVHREAGYPIVSIIHHLRSSERRSSWKNRLYRWVERRYLSTAGAFIYNSRTSQTVVEGLIGDGRPAIVAYPAGDRLGPALDHAQIKARAARSSRLELIFLGNVIPRKGLHTLLDALAAVKGADWRLTVVGSLDADPAYVRAIGRRLDRYGLSGRVALLGSISDRALAVQLAQSDVMAVPSSYEGFGIAYVEGMSFGLPALASTSGAASELITSGCNGFLVAPGDARSMANHLNELLHDRRRLLAMSLAAFERYRVHPSWSVSTERISGFLDQIGASTGPAAPQCR